MKYLGSIYLATPAAGVLNEIKKYERRIVTLQQAVI